jgi:HPt (histidine-containing phosphotransfer) domain-containing protein
VLDPEVLGRLERLGESAGEDLVGQLAMMFQAEASVLVAALRKALGRDDAAGVIRSAHTLSGASSNLGATDLARLCATLATDGADGNLADGGALLEAIEMELGRVCVALPSPRQTP